jgi:multidrug resistance efflux pump
MNGKAKDAQLDKAHRDMDQARHQLNRFEREIESLKSQLTKARLIQENHAVTESPSASNGSLSPYKSPVNYANGRSYAFTDEKENRYSSIPKTSSTAGHRTMTPAELGISIPSAETSVYSAGSVQNYKNAAELTARLRERIDSMKRATS